MVPIASRRKSHDGYTLIEMIIVAALVITGSVIAIPVSTRMVSNAKGDSALVLMVTFLESGRNRAVSERRNVELSFPADNKMRLERIEVPSGLKTVVGELQLEGESKFVKEVVDDTPDKFGSIAIAGVAAKFSGVGPVMFTSDGSLIDAAGDPTSGTIFVASPSRSETARAVTIAGVTGMMRSWKWRGSKWLQ